MNVTPPLHTAIIMDGNGRWAQQRGLPRSLGHRQGAKAVRRVVKAAPSLGIQVLTLYAFSSNNWSRPRSEVETLMDLLARFLRTELATSVKSDVRLSIIGRRDRLRPEILDAIETAEAATRGCSRLHLRLAVDYSARQAIASAAQHVESPSPCHETFARSLNHVIHSAPAAPDVDLLIRTGGEKRLSDFLLWESAYAELEFSDCLWPDFGEEDLQRTVEDFQSRQRRFGALPASEIGYPRPASAANSAPLD